MRGIFVPQNTDFWKSYFSQQQGGSLTPFRGYSYQRGAGIENIFKGLLRFILPIGKAIGKQALKSGLSLGGDILKGRDPREAILEHGRTGASKLMKKAGRRVVGEKKSGMQQGGQLGKRGKGINTVKTQPPKKKSRKVKKITKEDVLGLY
jgi:hypothetical protein